MIWEFDRQYESADRMYSLRTFIPKNVLESDFLEIESVASSVGGGGVDYLLDIDGRAVYSKIIFADTIHMNIFDMKVVAGSRSSVTHTKNSFTLFESFARSLTEIPESLLGKTITDKKTNEEYIITGILKDPSSNTSLMYRNPIGVVFINSSEEASQSKNDISQQQVSSFPSDYIVLVNKNCNINELREKLERSHSQYLHGDDEESDHNNSVLNDLNNKLEFEIYGYQNRLKDREVIIYYTIIFTVALLILLTALFNYVSFLIAQFYNRWKECALRKVNGASKYQIFLLFYIETVLGILLASVAALLLLQLFGPVIEDIYIHLSFIKVDLFVLRTHILQYVFIGMVLALPLCIAPAVTIDRNSLHFALMGGIVKGQKMKGRDILLFIQMLIVVVFMAFSVILMGQLNKNKSDILSYLPKEELDDILSVECSGNYSELWDKADDICKDLNDSPNISKARYSSSHIINSFLSGIYAGSFSLTEFNEAPIVRFDIPPHFVTFFGGKIVQGRLFDEESGSYDVVINKSFVDLYKGESPIGKTFVNPNQKTSDGNGGWDAVTYRIIGVVDELSYIFIDGSGNINSPKGEPMCYTNALSSTLPGGYILYVKIVHGKKREAVEHIESSIRKYISEGYPLNISTLKNDIDNSLQQQIQLSLIFRLLFGISLIIGLLSIYSSVTMNTEKRRKEVAIRKVNGGMIIDIIFLFCKKYILLWTAACLVAFPFVFYLGNRWLENYSSRISLDIGLFACMYFIILVLIILTIIFQILKVSRCNPADVLKSE
ncbi:MAG: ABC transporter permease [Dysgonomonas sp.]